MTPFVGPTLDAPMPVTPTATTCLQLADMPASSTTESSPSDHDTANTDLHATGGGESHKLNTAGTNHNRRGNMDLEVTLPTDATKEGLNDLDGCDAETKRERPTETATPSMVNETPTKAAKLMQTNPVDKTNTFSFNQLNLQVLSHIWKCNQAH